MMHRRLLAWYRMQLERTLFFTVIIFAAVFLGVMDAYIFQNPPWSATSFLNAHISIALLTSVYCLQIFMNDQPIFWREASHGLNRWAFFVARTTVDAIDWLVMNFLFTAVYYLIVRPKLGFYLYWLPFLMVGWVASGWGYLTSCTLPPVLAPFTVAVIAFMVGGILGLPNEMGVFLDGALLEFVVSVAAFTRWSVPMDFLAYLYRHPVENVDKLAPMNRYMLDAYPKFYGQGHMSLPVAATQWWTALFALFCMGLVLRLGAYVALCFVNRSKQV